MEGSLSHQTYFIAIFAMMRSSVRILIIKLQFKAFQRMNMVIVRLMTLTAGFVFSYAKTPTDDCHLFMTSYQDSRGYALSLKLLSSEMYLMRPEMADDMGMKPFQ